MVKSKNEPLCGTRARVSLGGNMVQPIELIVCPPSGLKIHSSQSTLEVLEIAKAYPSISLSSDTSEGCVRRVRFSGINETFTVMNRMEISSTERRKAWYRKSELRQADHRQDDVGQFHDNAIDWEFDFDLLENQLTNTQKDEVLECIRSFHRLGTISSVLDEQDRQKKNGIHDPILVSEMYKDAIRRARLALFIAALSSQEKERKRLKKISRDCKFPNND